MTKQLYTAGEMVDGVLQLVPVPAFTQKVFNSRTDLRNWLDAHGYDYLQWCEGAHEYTRLAVGDLVDNLPDELQMNDFQCDVEYSAVVYVLGHDVEW